MLTKRAEVLSRKCLIALISVTSGPNFLACSKMLRGACVCSCGARTRSLSAIVSLPWCRRLRSLFQDADGALQSFMWHRNQKAVCHWEFAERPWLDSWWSMVLGFIRRLSLLPEGSLHLDVLRDNIADARQPLMCANWAAGVDQQFRDLGMGSPFVSSGIGALVSLGFMSESVKRREQVG